MDQKKRYILDSSTLLHDPDCIKSFHEHDIVIPYFVIDQIDQLRDAPNGRGMSARSVFSQLEELRNGAIATECLPLGKDLGNLHIPYDGSYRSSRNKGEKMIECAINMAEEYDGQVILVAKDVGLRFKAASRGIHTEDYRKSKVKNGYTGLHPTPIEIDIGDKDLHNEEVPVPDHLFENEFCYIDAVGYTGVDPVLCRCKKGFLCPVPHFESGVMGIKPLDDSQRMAFDVLLDEDVTCVSLTGVAGSGKTLLALTAGLDMIEMGEYESLMTIKPIVPVGGRDIGYLKGDKIDKLYEWQRPIIDNLSIIQMNSGQNDILSHSNSMSVNQMLDSGRWQPEAMTFMRGRNLHGYWVVLDECQNLVPHEIKTALSRTGEKTKVVILADPSQIDSSYVDALSCGAAVAREKLKGSEMFAAVPMAHSQRSAFAKLVAERMD